MSAGIFVHEVCMSSQLVDCTFDLNDDCMMQEAVQQGGRDDRVTKHFSPFGEAAV